MFVHLSLKSYKSGNYYFCDDKDIDWACLKEGEEDEVGGEEDEEDDEFQNQFDMFDDSDGASS